MQQKEQGVKRKVATATVLLPVALSVETDGRAAEEKQGRPGLDLATSRARAAAATSAVARGLVLERWARPR